MKIINKYVCEICNREYHTDQEAIQCEAEGKEIPIVNLYQDIECRDDWNGGMGTCWDKLTVYEIRDLGHYSSYELGYLYDEGQITYRPIQSVYGNEGFNDMCRFIQETSK